MTITSADVTQLRANIVEYRDKDISHDELGTSGFREAQELRANLAGYFIDLLDTLQNVIDEVDPVVLEHVFETINSEGRYLGQIEKEINHLAKGGLHTERFPRQRTEQIETLRERAKAAKLALHPHEGLIRSLEVRKRLGATPLADIENEAAGKIKELERVLGEATKVLSNVQTKAMEKGVAKAKDTFDALASTHSRLTLAWFMAFIASAGIVTWAVLHIALTVTVPADVPEAIVLVFKRLLLLSVPSVFMKISLGKYNLERNLSIVYAHRNAVLAQYRTFEAAIGDDSAAKNQFRLEIAKYIFSDPVTGYVTSDASAEINVNPVIGMLERVMPGK